MKPSPAPRRRSARVLPALVLACAGALGACGGGSGDDASSGSGGGREPSAEVIFARDRAADYGARGDFWEKARAVLAPLVAREDAPLEDLLRAANAELAITGANDQAERAAPLLERARRLAPDDPVLLWCDYHVASLRYEMEQALAVLRRLRALRPDEFTVMLALAQTLDESDEPEQEKEAEALYRELLAIRPEFTGAWRVSMLYRLSQLLNRQGREMEAEPLFAELKELEAKQVTAPKDTFHSAGTLGVIPPHTVTLFERPAPVPAPVQLVRKDLGVEQAVGAFPAYLTLGEDVSDIGTETTEEEFRSCPRAHTVAFGARGVHLALMQGAGEPEIMQVHGEPVLDAAPFDRRNHGVDRSTDSPDARKHGDRDLDLLVLSADGVGTRLSLLENVGGEWSLRAEPLARLPAVSGPGCLVPVDYDHEGDVDLLVTTVEGPRLLRNDGLDGQGGFTDVSASLPFPAGDQRVQSEDFDGDNDVDFLFLAVSGGAPTLLSNDRGGRLVDATASLPAGIRGPWVVPADFDGDSWVDLAVFGADPALHARTELGGWKAPKHLALAEAPTGAPQACDWDLDGSLDLLWPCAAVPAAGLLAPGIAAGGVPVILGESFAAPSAGPATLSVADLDGDLDQDLLRLDATGLAAYLAEGHAKGIWIALQGHKDNARGLGAVVELRSGLVYVRIYYRGTPVLVGLGGKEIEVVRTTWPNGIKQGNFKLAKGSQTILAERPGQTQSCPFLYAWNGTTYEFISDVLGITPLGLPMGPGMPGSGPMMVPPDHDEYLLVKGEQLVPKDGIYELHFTEELREVTYLDRLRLDVVDHPEGTEVFPNERFSFPPFPEAHTHTVRDPLSPSSAIDQTGKDWSDELARDDKRFAIPFEALNGPYRGIATPYTLELAFDPARVQSAAKLRLFLNGWFYWTDASVNMSVAHHPDLEFVPPLLSVPDDQGGWKDCGPIGFPAGKLKTMAVDVGELLNREDPRLRLFSTLRLYWDSIRLATDADDAPFVTTALEPMSARLWQRGFSKQFALLGEHGCESFRWEELEEQPRWNQHPGLYTKLGETVPLLTAIDDQFVILGAGDALTVRFDARQAPPLAPGWRRDFLLFLDGWAKDRDPNTLEALYVEPLPFHGMSGYPYGPGEHFPDDEAHRVYRREWNTRPARQWIPALATPHPAWRPAAASLVSAD